MAKPTLENVVLGRLTYEDAYNWWEGQVEIREGELIDFSLSTWTGTGPKLDTDELLRRGVDFLGWARRMEPTVHARIADALLNIYNENWASDEDGEGRLSREQFLERVRPNSVDFHSDGSAYWYYSDGGLFAGHLIEVPISADREISDVGLAG